MSRWDHSLAVSSEWVILSSYVQSYRKVHIKAYQFLFSRKPKGKQPVAVENRLTY